MMNPAELLADGKMLQAHEHELNLQQIAHSTMKKVKLQ
jgi:hypothetical protein